jgi:branched-chain amino acid transport system permease protein
MLYTEAQIHAEWSDLGKGAADLVSGLPGSAPRAANGGRGVMSEFFSLLIAGIVTGSIYAVSASGLVVTYNTTGIFNFAHGAMGMVMAYLFWQLWQGWHWPVILALVVVLFVAAPLLGLGVERVIMRPLYGATTNIALVVTLGLLLLMVGVASTVWKQTNTYNVPEFFVGHRVPVGGVNLSYEQIITVGMAVVTALGLRLLFTRTRTGVAMRAVVDDPELAQLAGAPSSRLSGYAWMIGVMFAALAGILNAPQTMQITQLVELVIFGYAAAVVGRLRSLPLTFLGAMILGVGNSMAIGYVPAGLLTYVTAALPMALLFLVLVTMPQARLAIGRVVRPRPPRAATRRTTAIGSTALVVVVTILAFVVTGNNLNTLGTAMATGLLVLSLIPLAGYGGQVSLCQYTFAGLGALAMHWVGNGDSVLGLLAAIGLCGAGGALLSLPALRVRGLYLALATLAFAVLMDNLFFVSPAIMGPSGVVHVGRPHIFGIDFATTRSFVIFLALVFAACLFGVGALRRGSFGRRLVAMSDSPAACTTVGLNLTATRLVIFSMSAAMAGLAGALLAGIGQSAGSSQFIFFNSLVLFVALTLQGTNLLSTAVGAGFGIPIAAVIGSHIPALANFTYLAFGVGIIAIGRNPNAMGKVFTDIRDGWERRRGRVAADVLSVTAPVEPEVSPVG